MAKRFSDLGIKQEDRRIFDCPLRSVTDIVNVEIEVTEFLADVKTKNGPGRYLVRFKSEAVGEGKFFTNSKDLKGALAQVKEGDLPFLTTIKAVRCGQGKIYQFT